MARPLRVEYSGALYHVTARGNERKAIFRTDDDRRTFLTILAAAVGRYRLALHAYVLMDNHYHLLLETHEANLALALRHLNGVYTGGFNRAHRRVGHLFQGRYKAILVEKESYLVELSRYIHLNPIRTTNAVRLDRYPWSSYRAYIGRQASPAWLTREVVLGPFGARRAQAQVAYQAFVQEGAHTGVERPWDRVVGQLVLGREQFVDAIRKMVERGSMRRDDREVPSRRQLRARPTWDELMVCAKAAAPKLGALKRGARSNPERAVLCYLAREHGGLSLRDLATRFGVDESTISQTASRVATWRASDRRWEQALRSIEDVLSPNP